MMQSASKPIWEITPIIKKFQFSYRFLVLETVFASVIAASVVKRIKNNSLIIILCVFTILITILNWGNRRVIPELTDSILKQELLSGRTETSYVVYPIWTDFFSTWITRPISSHIEVVRGAATIKEQMRTPVVHRYLIKASEDSMIKENTLYFPGWELTIDNKPALIFYKNKIYPDVIYFSVSKGDHNVTLQFKDTLVRKLSKYISIISVLLFLFLLIYRKTYEKK